MLALLFVLAQSGGSGGAPVPALGHPWDYLLSYGVVGLVLLALLMGYLHTKWDYDGLVKDRDAIRKERDDERVYTKDLEKSIREQVIPLLTQVQGTTLDAARLITEARAEMTLRRTGGGSA